MTALRVPYPPDRSLYELHLDLLTNALVLGDPSTRRIALPLELALIIMSHLPPVLHSHNRGAPCSVYSEGPVVFAIVVQSQPVPSMPLALRIRTLSRDQGFVGDPGAGNYSWFELALQPAAGAERERSTWITHWNRLAHQEFTQHEVVLPRWHELWARIREGDTIALLACSEFPAWKNEVEEAELILFRAYQPNFDWIDSWELEIKEREAQPEANS